MAVASASSVQLAADRIGLTQSAVTRAIRRVEDTIGSTLFDRSARPLVLTHNGQIALERAQAALEAVGEFETLFSSKLDPSGPFRLGVPHALTHLLFREDGLLGLTSYPALETSIFAGWSHELQSLLRSRSLDAAITLNAPSRATSDEASTQALKSARLNVVSALKYLEQAADLAAANALGWALNPDGCGYRKALEAALGKEGMTPNIRLETNSLDVQFMMAERGEALTLAPQMAVRYLLERYDVSFIKVRYLSSSVAVHVSTFDLRDDLKPVIEELLQNVHDALS